SGTRLNVKPKFHHVAVVHNVIFAFHADFAGSFSVVHGTGGNKILKGNHFGFNESTLEVGVNHTGSFWGSVTFADGPGAGLFRASGQVSLQAKSLETNAGQLIQAGFILTVHF